MKNLICALLFVAAFPLLAADPNVTRLSEPVETGNGFEVFGATLPSSGTALKLAELVDNSENYQDQQVLVSTRIAKVCQKKGCFFVAQDGAATVRITFRDYGFFIPTDAGGKQATVYGTFSRKAVSQAQAEHYAKDLGEELSDPPATFEYALVADSIKIFEG